jgi:hypothetical protein
MEVRFYALAPCAFPGGRTLEIFQIQARIRSLMAGRRYPSDVFPSAVSQKVSHPFFLKRRLNHRRPGKMPGGERDLFLLKKEYRLWN